ncbi:phosphatase PAP2 family protein [Maribacter sp. 2304DJ31-5]|uniref:phosphatase PAP2 family protein n=1 Tax=Maribacter sp. 2304DJ31-5 TaxID=3386273 RepID=UPI0039BD7DBB
MWDRILQWDRETFIYLNSLGMEHYDHIWSTITKIPTWIPLFILFGFLFFRKYPKREAIFMVLTVLIMVFFVVTLTDLTKEAVARLRPNNDPEINKVIRILRNPSGYSFFSGHASTSFSITTLVFLFLRRHFRWTWIFYIWPLLFAWSRIYVGVHFPTDLIVGTLIGIFSAWIFYCLHLMLIVPYLRSNRPV